MGGAHAAVLDLSGLIGGANVYSLSNFYAPYSDVEGSMLIAGNLTASSYSVNANNKDAFATKGNGYAAIVGGNLNYTNGSINNGNIYVGGKVTTSIQNTISKGAAPVSFSTLASTVKADSKALGKLTETGSSIIKDSTMTLSGTGTGVQVFSLTNSELSGISNFNISNIASGSTIVVNVSGTSANFREWGVGLSAFQNYNVVYNFYEANSLSVTGVGLYGTLLAPLASVTGAYGQINGNVIVGDWNSAVQINSNHYFTATNIAGLQLAAAVPEPETWGMLLGGLGLIGAVARRRGRVQA
ncbi:choice-of-anchor A family protein [Oxalobacteraceae bacterium A2-2]